MNKTNEPRLARHLSRNGNIFTEEVVTVVDVGARYGCDPIWEYAFGNNVIQHGFEPDPEEYKKLVGGEAKRNTSNSKYYPVALHSNEGQKEFFYASYPAASGFYKPDEQFWKRFQAEVAIFAVRSEIVDTIDLDAFGKLHNLGRIDFLKLDVEGGELDVLKGCKEYITTGILGILTEVRFHDSSNSPTFTDTDYFLREMGFKLYNLEVNRNTRKSLSHLPTTFRGKTVPWGFSKGIGQVVSGDALYFRDAVAEMTTPQKHNIAWNDTVILKLACFYEMFGLPDCAIELIQQAEKNGFLTDYPTKDYCNLLTPEYEGEAVTYKQYLDRINTDYISKVTSRYDHKWKNIFELVLYKLVLKRLSPAMYIQLRRFKNLLIK
jgi:FkbM family methyltransferase